MVQGQAACHARAAIVRCDREAIEAERAHQLDLVLRHLALGVAA
jgi:hypothetical protein